MLLLDDPTFLYTPKTLVEKDIGKLKVNVSLSISLDAIGYPRHWLIAHYNPINIIITYFQYLFYIYKVLYIFGSLNFEVC